MKIFKYELPILESFSLDLPVGARILRVDDIDGRFFMWAMVDEESDSFATRNFEMYKTGQKINEPHQELLYLGLCKLFIMQELGLYVFERVIE